MGTVGICPGHGSASQCRHHGFLFQRSRASQAFDADVRFCTGRWSSMTSCKTASAAASLRCAGSSVRLPSDNDLFSCFSELHSIYYCAQTLLLQASGAALKASWIGTFSKLIWRASASFRDVALLQVSTAGQHPQCWMRYQRPMRRRHISLTPCRTGRPRNTNRLSVSTLLLM